jgi:transposase
MATEPVETGFVIERLRWDGTTLVLDAMGAAAQGRCPSCETASDVVHGIYQRRPLELPWRGQVVRFHLTVRRFRCLDSNCARVTFVEDCGAALPRAARRTQGVTTLLRDLAQVLGGEAGARAARAVGVPVSPDTLLRLLRSADDPQCSTPRVLGVDDFAFRRGCRYGTILIDMETHRPVDLLDDRDAATVAEWLRVHPGVEIIVRDRAGAYAEGARAGAPDAVQVADRFHLVQNASAALEEVLRSRRRRTEWVPEPAPEPALPAASADVAPATTPGEAPGEALAPAAAPPAEERPASAAARQRAARRAVRVARWEEIQARHAAGENVTQIARAVGKDRKTVRRYLATPATPPAPHVIAPRPSGLASPKLKPYSSYLQDRWQGGCTNAHRLYEELVARGYTGSYSLVRQVLRPWRPPRPPTIARPGRPGRRVRPRPVSARRLCLHRREQLPSAEQALRDQLLAADAELALGCTLREEFQDLVRTRDVDGLDAWLAAAHASQLAPFQSFANGLQRDRAAVEAGLTTPWSNGLVEGHVHRVKLIKRQGYGRAKLDLLRRRVLAA